MAPQPRNRRPRSGPAPRAASNAQAGVASASVAVATMRRLRIARRESAHTINTRSQQRQRPARQACRRSRRLRSGRLERQAADSRRRGGHQVPHLAVAFWVFFGGSAVGLLPSFTSCGAILKAASASAASALNLTTAHAPTTRAAVVAVRPAPCAMAPMANQSLVRLADDGAAATCRRTGTTDSPTSVRCAFAPCVYIC
jgi:hypothetical protein